MRPIRRVAPKQGCADGALATFAQKEGVWRGMSLRPRENIEIINNENDGE